MKPGATVYLYELAWILPSIAIPVGMLAALLVTAFGAGIHVPSIAGRVDPAKVTETAPFDQPGVVQTGPVSYEVRMIGQIWAFTPNEIRVPVGSTVTFVATSKDVIHGLFIPGANV
ncbi:MAG TPA: cytochrome C oxidase subunit II, partial [Methylomirabilota bacterium]|nr:cytochrome C oxidase subunit II [Methylomirabilota bacterium]